jgi:16S rRNA (cytosine967-C5)-methyltransferase
MCAVEAAGVQPGDRVLDLCAAPGGKSCYAAELLKGTGTVISRDLTREKTELIRDNVSRLGLSNITVEEWDATKTDQSFLAQADVVIADVPCSGLGIIGRKNDIKYKMNRENMQTLAQLAREILNQAAAYVKPGGTLLFSTCTINPEENEENARWFTANHPEYHITAERTFLQGVDFCDGFYYAVMKKEQ